MKKLLCILLLLPFLGKAQTVTTNIDSLIQVKIDASQRITTFKAGQVNVTQTGKYTYNADIIALATLQNTDMALTGQLATANNTIIALTARIAVLEAKPVDVTLAARIAAIETKLITGLTITGIAK